MDASVTSPLPARSGGRAGGERALPAMREGFGAIEAAMPADGLHRLRVMDEAHLLHPFTDHRRMKAAGAKIFVRGEGIHLIDVQGRRWIDAMSGLWCVTLGYSQAEIVAAAQAQMRTLPYCSSFFGTAHPSAIELAGAISALTPAGLDQVFFCNSGSEANDTAVRAVRCYWQRRGEPRRRIVISRRNAYHGSTYMGASLGGFECMHAQGGLPLRDVVHIRQPYWYGEGGHETPAQFGLRAAHAFEDAIVDVGADNVAAFIAEPIQAAGGVIIPPATYWPEIERIARRYRVPIIADEVVCGFGRTGAWFGCQHMHFTPQVMTLSKGLSSGYAPIAATVIARDIAETLRTGDSEFEHGFTTSGHPVSCAVALKTIEILQRDRIVDKVRDQTGPHFGARLAYLSRHALVAEVRAVGLMAALELAHPAPQVAATRPRGTLGAALREACAARQLIVRAEGDTVMIAPPLISTCSDLDQIVDRLDAALKTVESFVLGERSDAACCS